MKFIEKEISKLGLGWQSSGMYAGDGRVQPCGKVRLLCEPKKILASQYIVGHSFLEYLLRAFCISPANGTYIPIRENRNQPPQRKNKATTPWARFTSDRTECQQTQQGGTVERVMNHSDGESKGILENGIERRKDRVDVYSCRLGGISLQTPERWEVRRRVEEGYRGSGSHQPLLL